MTGKELAEKMILYRAKHNISGVELAKMCNITAPTIYALENEQKLPHKLTVAKVLRVIEEGNNESE